MKPSTVELALEALKEIVACGKLIKESLDASIAIGEPVHPMSSKLTWPLSTCIGAIAALEAEIAQPVESIIAEVAVLHSGRYVIRRWHGKNLMPGDYRLYTAPQAVNAELLSALQSMVAAFHPAEHEIEDSNEAYMLEWFPEWTKARAVLKKIGGAA